VDRGFDHAQKSVNCGQLVIRDTVSPRRHAGWLLESTGERS